MKPHPNGTLRYKSILWPCFRIVGFYDTSCTDGIPGTYCHSICTKTLWSKPEFYASRQRTIMNSCRFDKCPYIWFIWGERLGRLLNVICNDISVIYVTAHRCAGGLKKKFDLMSGSQQYFVGFFYVPVEASTRGNPFYDYSETPPHLVAFYEQNRSTEGCSKLQRSVDMTGPGKNGPNIRTNSRVKWDRTRCPEE